MVNKMALTITTLNVHHVHENHVDVLSYINGQGADIVCLQEVNVFLLETLRTRLSDEWVLSGRTMHGEDLRFVTSQQLRGSKLVSGPSGILGVHTNPIFIHKKHLVRGEFTVCPNLKSSSYYQGGRAQGAHYPVTVNVCKVLAYGRLQLTVVNVHLDTKHPQKTLTRLLTHDLGFEDLRSDVVVMCGDFNQTMYELDETLVAHNDGKSVVINRAMDLCDGVYDAPPAKARGSGRTRTDEEGRVCHILVQESLVQPVTSSYHVKVFDAGFSDHNAVTASFLVPFRHCLDFSVQPMRPVLRPCVVVHLDESRSRVLASTTHEGIRVYTVWVNRDRLSAKTMQDHLDTKRDLLHVVVFIGRYMFPSSSRWKQHELASNMYVACASNIQYLRTQVTGGQLALEHA